MKGDIFGNVYQQFCTAIKKDKWREINENISSSCLCFIRVLFSWQCKYMHDIYLWLCFAEW